MKIIRYREETPPKVRGNPPPPEATAALSAWGSHIFLEFFLEISMSVQIRYSGIFRGNLQAAAETVSGNCRRS